MKVLMQNFHHNFLKSVNKRKVFVFVLQIDCSVRFLQEMFMKSLSKHYDETDKNNQKT